IVHLDHETDYYEIPNLEEFYSSQYDFWLDSNSGEYHNPQNIKIDEVFTPDGEYILNSGYITDYFNKLEILTTTDNFLNLLKRGIKIRLEAQKNWYK
ncbi:hypothetical protein, partial [uncultured Flavobacterium sp.]|uniref:hypothetical protein n=1 Tax=uncultured Flavobacterium sp. TaxID=165435 RepID=UPI0025E035F1